MHEITGAQTRAGGGGGMEGQRACLRGAVQSEHLSRAPLRIFIRFHAHAVRTRTLKKPHAPSLPMHAWQPTDADFKVRRA